MGYRQCEYENLNYTELKVKKIRMSENIERKIRKKHMIGNHYSKISNKKNSYYEEFEKIYELKCAYCGINTSINPTTMFEVDHFVNKKQEFDFNGKTVNHLDNLVFSCRKCNQAKDSFYVNDEYELLHPDNGTLSKVFERDTDYRITINQEYTDNKTISDFYSKMGFSDRFRKIDYLILNLHYMKDIIEESKLRELTLYVYTILLEMRNRSIQ